MPPARPRLRRQIGVDVEEGGAWNVTGQVELAAASGIAELPAAIDELVAEGYQLPAGDAGSATELGWMT
jgi:hypothetical protein